MLQHEIIEALQTRSKKDPSFREELVANPTAVIAREMGIPEDQLAQEISKSLSDTELATITGGLTGYDDPDAEKVWCPECKEYIDKAVSGFFHDLFIHGKIG